MSQGRAFDVAVSEVRVTAALISDQRTLHHYLSCGVWDKRSQRLLCLGRPGLPGTPDLREGTNTDRRSLLGARTLESCFDPSASFIRVQIETSASFYAKTGLATL